MDADIFFIFRQYWIKCFCHFSSSVLSQTLLNPLLQRAEEVVDHRPPAGPDLRTQRYARRQRHGLAIHLQVVAEQSYTAAEKRKPLCSR